MKDFKFYLLISVSSLFLSAISHSATKVEDPAYDKVVQKSNKIADLMAGSQGMKATATPVEVTNLTHIAIQISLQDTDGSVLRRFCEGSQKVLSVPTNIQFQDHFKALIVLYFTTKALQTDQNLYDAPQKVAESIKNYRWSDTTIYAPLVAALQTSTPLQIGELLTTYRFATIYDYIQNHPSTKLAIATAIDYAEVTLQMKPTGAILPPPHRVAPPPPPPPRGGHLECQLLQVY